MFDSTAAMIEALRPGATVSDDAVHVTNLSALTGDVIDQLAWTASFGANAELKGTARWIIRSLAAAAGIRPALDPRFRLHGDGPRRRVGLHRAGPINVRAMAYDTARAVNSIGEGAERRRVHLRDRPF